MKVNSEQEMKEAAESIIRFLLKQRLCCGKRIEIYRLNIEVELSVNGKPTVEVFGISLESN